MRVRIKKLNNEKGMTIVEVITAIAFSMMALGALITLGVVTSRNADNAKKRSQAIELAKEGIEAVRVLRDNSVNFSNTKEFSVMDSVHCGNTLYAWTWSQYNNCPWKGTTFSLGKSGEAWYLEYKDSVDETNNYYKLAAPNDNFYRMITINDGPTGDGSDKEIDVTVTWQARNQTLSVTETTILTNWK